jgi:hypothetical protein
MAKINRKKLKHMNAKQLKQLAIADQFYRSGRYKKLGRKK